MSFIKKNNIKYEFKGKFIDFERLQTSFENQSKCN